MPHYASCGLSREHLGELAAGLAPQWETRCESGRRCGNRRDQVAASRTRIRRPATTRPAPAHPGRHVRLRRGRKRHAAHRRHRNPRSVGRRPDGPRRRQSSQRIAVEHANAELRQWRPLQRWTGRHLGIRRLSPFPPVERRIPGIGGAQRPADRTPHAFTQVTVIIVPRQVPDPPRTAPQIRQSADRYSKTCQ
jgi:hypothetical protein